MKSTSLLVLLEVKSSRYEEHGAVARIQAQEKYKGQQGAR